MAEYTSTMERTIALLLEEKKYLTLRDILVTMNPSDVAALFEALPEDRLPLLFRLLPKEQAAETFVEMEPEAQQLLIHGFSDTELKEVVDELYVDDAVDLIEEMPANVVKRILSQADPEMRQSINEILRYAEDSAGSIMTTEYISLRPTMHVDEAITRIRRTGVDKETIYTCYVTRDRKLIGIVTVKDLLLCEDDNTVIADIMITNVIHVKTWDDKEQVAQMLSKYNFLALPVLDSEERMVGIVTFDDAMDVIEEEATEDIKKMAAIIPSEKSYMRMQPVEIFKKRVPWLTLLMISSTFTGFIISYFENQLYAMICLSSFIPMLMGSAGNAGSQTSVTIIRGLSLNEIKFSDLAKVIWKEIRVAVLCGLVLAAACFAKVMLVDCLLLQTDGVNWIVALVVCLALAVTVLASKIVGCVLPMLADKLGFDPALMASPLITTVVDALSLLVYFNIARAILGL
ncbi:MAG: magnesium transporter [Oscillospiraceae bacterium]|nr:magnesium transporter [Oscillospiraceae bacterium]